jgi:beta-N-acetylhexosaminidase
MEGRIPPDDDDPFEWTEPPPRPPREHRPGAGEAEDPGTGERRIARGDTGEFERSGRPPPHGRRERHRDLPARIRRRQAFVIGGIALLVLIGLIALVSGGGGEKTQPQVGLKRLVGQTIIAPVKGVPNQDLLRRARHGQIGGVILLPKSGGRPLTPDGVRAAVNQLQQAAKAGKSPPLLILVDQEGGDVKRLPDGPPGASPKQLGQNGDEGASRDAGQSTGSYLRGLGINVDLAPVLDVSQPATTADSIKSRTFGSDPATVAKVGVAFAEGLQDGGVVATAKHFPGLGRATVNTDDRPVSIAATTDQLQSDLEPFKAAVDAGVGMVMVSTATYPTLGSKKEAAFSPAIVRGLLRDQLGFGGVVITDDLESPAVTGVTTPSAAASDALEAGDDLLLFAKTAGASQKAYAALITQVKRGHLNRETVQAAYDRITHLKDNPPGS